VSAIAQIIQIIWKGQRAAIRPTFAGYRAPAAAPRAKPMCRPHIPTEGRCKRKFAFILRSIGRWSRPRRSRPNLRQNAIKQKRDQASRERVQRMFVAVGMPTLWRSAWCVTCRSRTARRSAGVVPVTLPMVRGKATSRRVVGGTWKCSVLLIADEKADMAISTRMTRTNRSAHYEESSRLPSESRPSVSGARSVGERSARSVA